MKFKEFVNKSEALDIKNTLSKIPKKHFLSIKDYKVSFESGEVLKGDSKHIGFIDEKNKKIKIASPWYYSKEFTLLHEIAHSVWKNLDKKQKQKWKEIVKVFSNKDVNKEAKKSLNQNDEEIFCMCYANFYSKHKLLTYDEKTCKDFIKNL